MATKVLNELLLFNLAVENKKRAMRKQLHRVLKQFKHICTKYIWNYPPEMNKEHSEAIRYKWRFLFYTPERSITHFRASPSGDRLNLCSSGASYGGFWSSQIGKGLIGLQTCFSCPTFVKSQPSPFPTDPFTILQPQDPDICKFCVVQKRRAKMLKLKNCESVGRAASSFLWKSSFFSG